MTTGFRRAYSVIGAFLMLELVAQFYLIAGAIFTIAAKADAGPDAVKAAVQNADSFAALHAINGTFVVPFTIILLLGVAFAARFPRPTIVLNAILLGLMV